MKEMQKLNIGAGNTVEPTLDEGPLDFVGRFWEKVKPRNTAYIISENVGEIKKPGEEEPLNPLQQHGKQVGQNLRETFGPIWQKIKKPGDEEPQSPAQQQGQQVLQNLRETFGPIWQKVKNPGEESPQNLQQHGKQVMQNLRETLGPVWQKTETLVEDARDEIVKKAKEIQQLGQQPDVFIGQQPPQWRERPAESAGTVNDGRAAASAEDASAGPSEPASAPANVPPVPAMTEAANSEEPSAAASAAASSVSQADEFNEAAAAAVGAGKEDISSTILIEARLTIDDGSTQTLYVRAADRCKEVAQRFVMEHSLKDWFQEPLTAWLKKVESDAVKFPVIIEGDLLDIRNQHSKNQ